MSVPNSALLSQFEQFLQIVSLTAALESKTQLETIQIQAIRIITGAPKGTSCNRLYEETKLEILENRRVNKQLTIMYCVPSCECGHLRETTEHYFLDCINHGIPRREHINPLGDRVHTQILLYGD
jgi:hypothetical protein